MNRSFLPSREQYATFATYTNLLSNAGFETGSSVWGLAAQASIDNNPADARSGNNSLKLVATSQFQASSQMVPMTPGQMYAFSAWGRSTSSGGDFCLVAFDSNRNYLGQVNLAFAGSGAWTPVTTTYQAPANATRLFIAPQDTGTFWFDDLSLTHS